MKILIKDNDGNVIVEKEINKEEVLLKINAKEAMVSEQHTESSGDWACGAYH